MAAVIHDYLYQHPDRSRRDADEIFLEAMGVLGIARWRRCAMWAAVGVGGHWAYRG